MTNTQFSTIIRLFAEQNQYIDRQFIILQNEIDKKFKEESKKRTTEHLAVMKAMEVPFLEHEVRLTHLEKSLLQPS